MSTRILIIEDEADLVMALEYHLRREGFVPQSAGDGETGLELARQTPQPDLILLDLMLPDLSGVEVCRRLRASPETAEVPVMMLTARGEEIDRVTGFQVGADDYVTKPFSTRELLLRIRAVLRRVTPRDEVERPQRFGVLRVDPGAYRVWIDDGEITLTALEFRLLQALMDRRGQVWSRSRLLDEVWEEPGVTSRTVDTHIKRLRQKLGPASAYIETVRGVGYRFLSEPPG